MAVSAEEAKKAVKKCYPNLLELLPINELVERLFSREMLSLDRKSRLDSLASPREKIQHFLDHTLIPGLHVGYTVHFDEMISMMKEGEDDVCKSLVEKLIPNVAATPTEIGHDEIEKVDFSAYKDVSNAFVQLFSVCQKAIRVSKDTFKTIKHSCVARAAEPLRGLLKHTTDIDCLFEVLSENDKFFNWMDVRLLEAIAFSCGNEQLQSLINDYTTVIQSKPLHEVWDDIPQYLSVRDQYYSELKVGFRGKDPDNVTVKELMRSKPKLAKEIAVLIGTVHSD